MSNYRHLPRKLRNTYPQDSAITSNPISDICRKNKDMVSQESVNAPSILWDMYLNKCKRDQTWDSGEQKEKNFIENGQLDFS